MAKFIHLRNHTEYSLCSGAIKMKKLVALAKENGIPALTITDSHNMFGVLEFSEICTKAGIQPIIGCETVIDFNELLAKSTVCQTVSERESNFCKAVLIAKTDEGFLNLISLLSQSYLKRESGIKPQLEESSVKEYPSTYSILSVIPEKPPAFTTLGFTMSFDFRANFLAYTDASPAYPPILAPIPVGTINAPSFSPLYAILS